MSRSPGKSDDLALDSSLSMPIRKRRGSILASILSGSAIPILPYAEENEATGDDTILILPFDGEVNPETAYNEIGDALKSIFLRMFCLLFAMSEI